MRLYTEVWNYTLTSSSSPYAINTGTPSTDTNKLLCPASAYVSKGYTGTPYEFSAENYHGSYALQFSFDPRNSNNARFHLACYAEGYSNVPTILTVGTDGISLGWGSFLGNFDSSSDSTPGATGDFYGNFVPENGIYTVLFIKRDVVGNTSASEVAACVTAPSGAKYKTGWALVSDSFKRNLLGCALDVGSGYVIVGEMQVADELTDAQTNAFLVYGGIDTRPIALITPASKTTIEPVTVTLTPPDSLPVGWTLRYTTNGSNPSGEQSLGGFDNYPFTGVSILMGERMRNSICGSADLFLMRMTVGTQLVRIEDTGAITIVADTWVPDPGDFFSEGALHVDGLVYLNSIAETMTAVCDPTTGSVTAVYPSWIDGNDTCFASDPVVGTLAALKVGTGIYSISPYGTSSSLDVITLLIPLDSSFTAINTSFWFWGSYLFVSKNDDTNLYIYSTSDFSLFATATKQIGDFNVCSATKWFTLRYAAGVGIKLYERDLAHLSAVEESSLIATATVTTSGANPLVVGATVDGTDIVCTILDVVDPIYRISTLNGVIPANGTVYTTPFVVGAPLALGTSKEVRAAYIEDATSVVGSIASETYTFAMSTPVFVVDGTPENYASGTNAIPIRWLEEPSNADFQIIYTVDGSDPTTSLTALTWTLGATIPFNAYPVTPGLGTPDTSQTNQPLQAVLKHVESGVMSGISTTLVQFYLNNSYLLIPAKANDDLSLQFVYEPHAGRSLKYALTIDGVTTTTTSAPIISIPFDDKTHTIALRISTADDSIYTDAWDSIQPSSHVSSMYFYQKTPKLPARVEITSTEALCVPVNTNASPSIMRYTLTGEAPTISSQLVTGPILVQAGSVLKVIAERASVLSSVALVEALPEYEVTEAAVTLDDVNYHYHTAAQRIALTSQLGNTNISVPVGTNVTPTKVNAIVGGQTYQISLWDSTNHAGAYNQLTSLLWSSRATKFWSRLSYTAGSFAFNWTYDPLVFPANTTLTLFSITVSSKRYRVVFDYVVNTTTRQSSIVRTRMNVGGSTSTPSTTVSSVLVVGSNTLTLSITSNAVSLSDGAGTSTETSNDFSGVLWAVLGTVNPDEIGDAVDATIACTVTTTATSGLLRMAPASVLCSKSNVSSQKTVSLDFRNEDTYRSIRHSMLTDGVASPAVDPPAIIGFNDYTKATQIDGLFSLAFPGVVDTTQNFDASIKLSTDFLSLMTYPEATVNSALLPTVSLFLADPTSRMNDLSDVVTGISLRMFVPADRPGAYPVHLELYSSGQAPTRLTLSSNSKQIELRVSGRADGITLSAVIDGVTTTLTTLPAITDAREIRFRRTGSTKLARKQVTNLIGYAASATYIQVACTNPVIVGADFMFRGNAVGFPATPLTLPDNTVSAVWFDAQLGALVVEAIAFEPSDGRLLVGILEMIDNNIIWTNTMYASLIKVRTQVESNLTGGTVIGVGSNLEIADGHATWTECGYRRKALIGNLNWNTPINHLDLRQGRQIIRALESQRIRVTSTRISLQ